MIDGKQDRQGHLFEHARALRDAELQYADVESELQARNVSIEEEERRMEYAEHVATIVSDAVALAIRKRTKNAPDSGPPLLETFAPMYPTMRGRRPARTPTGHMHAVAAFPRSGPEKITYSATVINPLSLMWSRLCPAYPVPG